MRQGTLLTTLTTSVSSAIKPVDVGPPGHDAITVNRDAYQVKSRSLSLAVCHSRHEACCSRQHATLAPIIQKASGPP